MKSRLNIHSFDFGLLLRLELLPSLDYKVVFLREVMDVFNLP